MNYGDFSSVVQLGVGLHAGTALLQTYGEIGVQPLERIVARTRSLVEGRDDHEGDLVDALALMESDFEIFRIRLFNTYRIFIVINLVIAVLLTVALVVMSYVAQSQIPEVVSIPLVAISILPAMILLGVLWFDAAKAMTTLKQRARVLEQEALSGRRKT